MDRTLQDGLPDIQGDDEVPITGNLGHSRNGERTRILIPDTYDGIGGCPFGPTECKSFICEIGLYPVLRALSASRYDEDGGCDQKVD
jgi:hypothetical protein